MLNRCQAMRIFAIVFFVVFALGACHKEKIKTPSCDGSNLSYTTGIKTILDANCTSAGCHPNFNTYIGISGIIQDGSFYRNVLNIQSMPQNKSLSQDQLNKLQCWVNNGYPN